MLFAIEKYVKNDHIVHKLENGKATNYILLKLVDSKLMGVFLNNKEEIIYINIYQIEYIYSSEKIQVLLEEK